MSYIESNNNSFVSIKLTEKGREQLAKGKLNFSNWAIGDSEINYVREEIVDAGTANVDSVTRILRPKDRQPNIKYFISTGQTVLNPITGANLKTIKAVISNAATDRGFFSGTTFTGTGFNTLTGSPYTQSSGVITTNNITGGTVLSLGTGATRSVGDVIVFHFTNHIFSSSTTDTNADPLPTLFYKIQDNTSDEITVDRTLPNLSGESSGTTAYYIYKSGDTSTAFGSGTTSAYWDTGTLSFDAACDITVADVPVWNQNNIWSEDLAGLTGTSYEDHTKYGSYAFLGQKDPYLNFDLSGTAQVVSGATEVKCEGISQLDPAQKSLAILHYTNNTISNLYGEFLHVENTSSCQKHLKLHFPTLMYHRRNFTGGTGTGDKMGMTFIATGGTKFTGSGTSAIEFHELLEDSSMIASGATPQVIGRVYPQLKTVAIYDEEIVAATSYKSNRNWTLPPLATSLVSPSGSTGILTDGSTMYVTYILENSGTTGLTSALPCQRYAKITNSSGSEKDIEFRLEANGILPYMRKIETGWDGYGFYAHQLKVLYQVVTGSTRPDPGAWKVADYTSLGLTSASGETIDPVVLENQSPATNGFVITPAIDSGTTTFNLIDILNLPPNVSPDELQFGDERFFYGNIQTYIGAAVYKSIFDIRVNAGMFNQTSNPTRSKDASTNPPNIKISEVGIYDDKNNLVMIGKISKPVMLQGTNTIILELSIDF